MPDAATVLSAALGQRDVLGTCLFGEFGLLDSSVGTTIARAEEDDGASRSSSRGARCDDDAAAVGDDAAVAPTTMAPVGGREFSHGNLMFSYLLLSNEPSERCLRLFDPRFGSYYDGADESRLRYRTPLWC